MALERKRKKTAKTGVNGKKAEPAAKEATKKGDSIKSEALIIAVLALSVLLALCVFTESVGVVGGAVKKALFSVFGVGAVILPFAVMLGCIFAGFKKFRKTSRLKNILMGTLFFAAISIFHVFYQKKTDIDVTGPVEYLSYYIANGSSGNGGFFGALIGGPLVKMLGTTGALVALFAIVIICIVIITERSIFELLAGAAAKTADTAKKLNTERLKRKETEQTQAALPQTPIDDLKRKLDKKDNNYNQKLKWVESGDEFDGMTFGQVSEIVEKDPEKYGFGSETQDVPEEDTVITPAVHELLDIPPDGFGENIVFENFDEQGDESDDVPPFELDKPSAIVSAPVGKAVETTDYLKKGEAFTNQDRVAGTEEKSKSVSNGFIDYVFPPLSLLHAGDGAVGRDTKSQMLKNAQKLEDTLKSFGVIAKVVQINRGPTVTRYELTPESGVKVSRIVGLADDIALNLASDGIRIEAPVPGKSVVGIEVPNKERTPVYLREVLESHEFKSYASKVGFGVGKDIGGSSIVADISDMPHLLIAGATGAGKSVCINTLITSILYKASPNEVKLILIDPKVVELGIYDGIPHLLIPVVTDPKKAAGALNWAVHQMNERYHLFKDENVRDLEGYNNSKAEKLEFDAILPKIVIIIDELSDLMMTAPKEVEDSIMRLAQKARAAGLHLVLATQRPSVDVITGVIKANIPSRLAFAVSSGTDSRTILDMIGAEKLLGRGDMLFSPRNLAKPVRIQGAYISDKEVENIVGFIKKHSEAVYDEQMVEEITTAVKAPLTGAQDDGGDEMYEEVLEFVLTKKDVSVSMLQRQFRIGYNRAARIVDTLEKNGVVSAGSPDGAGKPSRKVLANSYGDD